MAPKETIQFLMKNFRSVADGSVEIKPITILTGANGAGKSSFMYGLMVLRNLFLNANQPVNNFFNLGFMNLGGVKEVVTGKNIREPIMLGCRYTSDTTDSSYFASIGSSSYLGLEIRKPFQMNLGLGVSFPYPFVQNATHELTWKDRKYEVIFNGFDVNIVPVDGQPIPEQIIKELRFHALIPTSIPRLADFVDVRRGFFRNTYAAMNVPASAEDEIASQLGSDRDLEATVSVVLEKMINKSFAARHAALGSSNFYLQTTDRETGFVCDLVNEGFGVNQLVYLLAKVLKKDSWIVCIEEPETHLHPEALTKLAEQLLRIATTEPKKFLIASHSENFVASLLNLVAQGKATPDDIGIHFVAKDATNLTKVAEQKINEKGQIEGGLRSFYEPSIRALEDFLGSQRDSEHVNPA